MEGCDQWITEIMLGSSGSSSASAGLPQESLPLIAKSDMVTIVTEKKFL